MPEKKYVDEETFHKLIVAVDGNRVELEKLQQEIAGFKAALTPTDKPHEPGKKID